MRKRAGTSQRLRQDQREKAWLLRQIQKQNPQPGPAEWLPIIHSVHTRTLVSEVQVLLQAKVNASQGLVQGSRAEMMSRRASLVRDNYAGQRWLALRRAWAQRLNAISPKYVGPGCDPRLKEKHPLMRGSLRHSLPQEISEGRETKAEERGTPHHIPPLDP